MKKIVILPVFNESRRVEGVLAELAKFADLLILVNDGSSDNSLELLRKWLRGRTGVYLLNFPANRGKAKALQAAFALTADLLVRGVIAPEDIVFTTDADGQIQTSDLDRALAYMQAQGLEALISRRDFSLYPAYKIAGNRILSFNASLAAGRPFYDSECGLRLLTAALIPRFLPYYTGIRYSAEQEISVILSRLQVKLDNNFTVQVQFYRSHTTLKDAVLNLLMGQFACLRVCFRQKQDLAGLLKRELVYLETARG